MSVMIIVTARASRAELGSIAAEENFPSWPREEHFLRKQILPQVKNLFASRTQILRPKQMFPSLVTMKTLLTCFQ